MTLFYRTPHAENVKARAHRVLDDVRAGIDVPTYQITWALRVTGDLQ